EEARGAQGVPLTATRSIAVDKALHVYGTPFFIAADLPIATESSATKFRRLMVAQDTGSAIVGPARADIYFGSGVEAGRIAGRAKRRPCPPRCRRCPGRRAARKSCPPLRRKRTRRRRWRRSAAARAQSSRAAPNRSTTASTCTA